MKDSGKKELYRGVLKFLWEELKTMNRAKLSSLYRIGVGYLRMKYYQHKKITTKRKSDFEASYRIHS